MILKEDDLPKDVRKYIAELRYTYQLLCSLELYNVALLIDQEINYIKLYYQAYKYPYHDNRDSTF